MPVPAVGDRRTALAHKVRDDPMERRASEVQRLPRSPRAFLAGAERTKVFRGLRDDVRAQRHFDAAGWRATHRHIEIHDRVGPVAGNSSQSCVACSKIRNDRDTTAVNAGVHLRINAAKTFLI